LSRREGGEDSGRRQLQARVAAGGGIAMRLAIRSDLNAMVMMHANQKNASTRLQQPRPRMERRTFVNREST
jgi:hypothetical protein